MSDGHLESLLTGLEDAVQGSPEPAVDRKTAVRVSCSMADRTSTASLWPVDPSWTVRTVGTLGNQTWEEHEGERVMNGSIARLTTDEDVRATQVVGHTACTVIEDAYERYLTPVGDAPAGIEARLAPLVSLVTDAVDSGVVDPSTSPRTARYRLVEYAVVRHVEFLRTRLPPSVLVAGYVHDQDGVYGSFPGNRYLVSVDGVTGTDAIRSQYPVSGSVPVANLRRSPPTDTDPERNDKP